MPDVICVMHVIDTGGPGGAETVFLQLATRLDPARFQSVAVVGNNGWLAEQLEKRSLVPHILSAKGSFKTDTSSHCVDWYDIARSMCS